jgi:hypothetical protein
VYFDNEIPARISRRANKAMKGIWNRLGNVVLLTYKGSQQDVQWKFNWGAPQLATKKGA